jgi:Ca-activated chloride channel homolog
MNMRRFLLFLSLLAPASPALGQAPSTRPAAATGAISGQVRDTATGETMAGVTIVATSPSLVAEQVVISDEAGAWTIAGLPPGTYTLTFYYLDVTIERVNLVVTGGQTLTITQAIDSSRSGGETIQIQGGVPAIGVTSTSHGITLSRSYLRNIPVGRTYTAVLGPPPPPPHNTETYDRIDENPWKRVDGAPLSTFSTDVDTASFANVRRFLSAGERPPIDAVRIEELLNYFKYTLPAPKDPKGMAVTTEVGPTPWNDETKLVRVALQTAPIAAEAVPPRNLTFLLDTSGSMDDPNKLPLVQYAMGLVVDTLRPQDTISIVTYAGSSGLALPPTGGAYKAQIKEALRALEAGGSTNGAEGIQLAYQTAREHFATGGINRVILCTDGDFNVGITNEGDLTRLIERERDDGIFLTVLGFGMGNLKDATLEKLADRGNGNYGYIDSNYEAKKLLVENSGATMVTVAKDVKIQVEMNPARVAGYRLIGYENRLLADEDFDDDTKDAGELGAGHAVTALYEIVPVGGDVPAPPSPRTRYSTASTTTEAAHSNELMMVKVRFKAPEGTQSRLLTHTVTDRDVDLDDTTIDFHFAAAVVGFGMLLCDSEHRGALSWGLVENLAKHGIGSDAGGYRRPFLSLLQEAKWVVPVP